MIDVVIQGVNGRMGRVLTALIAARADCRVAAGVDLAVPEHADFPVFPSLVELYAGIGGAGGLAKAPDVLIDFSLPEATRAALNVCAAHGLPSVVCTTGLSEADKGLMDATAQKAAVFYSANMSLGVNVLTALAKQAAAVLQGFDIEIVERHHRNKIDAPSGTAIALANAVNDVFGGSYELVMDRHTKREKRGDKEIGLQAVRGGSIVGEHDVIFAGPDEVITLSHTAYSRDIFASGAIMAALYVAGKPAGMYDMADLISGR